MKKRISIFGLLLAGIAASFMSQANAAHHEEEEAYGYLVWGEWHRSAIDFYINKLNQHTTISAKQETKVRELLNHEADELVKIQKNHRANLVKMLEQVIALILESQETLSEILTEEQRYILPTILEIRKENLKEQMGLLLNGLWYQAENPE